tara:strand:- start:410 stop:3400 length:2991 start_codon:yes stop_codon:yes gene_type:complete
MRLLITALFVALTYSWVLGQETFPVNGVNSSFEPVYAFTNAHIVISPNSEIKNGSLLIQGNKILAVDSNLAIPKGSIINDLQGDFIYPSFIDLYTNYGLPEIKEGGAHSYLPQYKSKKNGAYHWNEAIHPEINASDKFINNTKDAKNYLNNGFGAVVTHLKDGILRGTGALVLLSEKSNQENIIQKESATFYSFKKGKSRQKNPTSLMGSIALIRQTLLDAEWYSLQSEQVNLSYLSYNKTKGLPKIFSISNVLDYQRVFKIADEYEIDFIIKGNGKEYSRIQEVIASESPVIIPINFPNAYDVSNPESAEWISLNTLKDWELSPYNPVILANNKVQFCITSSGLEKRTDFIKNLRIAIKKGLKKSDALAALTTNPAVLINANKQIGTLESGKIANFFIASKDIFEDGDIYEIWSSGKQHVIKQKPLFDLRGYYTLKSDEFQNEFVQIKGSIENLETTILKLDSTPLTTSLHANTINISLPNGTFRAVAKLSNDSVINGRYQNEMGIFYNFSMTRDSLFNENNKSPSLEIQSNIPSVWFPNKAHGKEVLEKHKSIIFRNTTVWTNEKEGILLNTDVIISKGKIIAIGTMLNPLDYFNEGDFITIDASKLNLTSGIIDEHSHIAISRGVNEASQAVSAEVRIGDVINPEDHNIYRQLAGGTVVSQLLHGSANPIGGQSAIIKLRWGESAEKMKISNTDGYIKFALGENVKQSNWGDFERIRFPQTRMGVEQVFYDAFYRAKEYQKSWREYNNLALKEKRNTVPPREDLELNTLVEILNSERFITCHSYVQSEINMLMHVADSMGFTIDIFTHILEGYKLADKMKEHGAGASTFSDWWAYKFEVNDAIPYNATLLNKKGVITAINSDDAEMGRRLNQEAAKAVKYGGTSEEDAWKMITLNPAKLLRLDNRMGSVKAGKDADIVLWTDNPLSIYAKVVQTYVDGKLMYDIKLDQELRKRDLKERMRIIKLMSEDKNGEKKEIPKPDEEKLYHCDSEDEE